MYFVSVDVLKILNQVQDDDFFDSLESTVFRHNSIVSFITIKMIQSLYMQNEESQSIDAFGNVLSHGDTIMLTKALDVRGTKVNLKKGTVIKNIRLTDDPEEIACSAPEIKGLILRTEFVKKK